MRGACSVLRGSRCGRALCALGLMLAIVGYLGPWVPHRTAALTVTGLELAEFAKFFPQVQGGVVSITRELFYLPLITALILLGLCAGRSTVRWVRLAVPLLLAGLLLVALLPYSAVNGLRQALATRSNVVLDPQYAGQLRLVVAGVVLILLAPLARRLPVWLQGMLDALLALGGVVPAVWQFACLRPLVMDLYARPLGLGWGLIACAAGFAVLLVWAILAMVHHQA